MRNKYLGGVFPFFEVASRDEIDIEAIPLQYCLNQQYRRLEDEASSKSLTVSFRFAEYICCHWHANSIVLKRRKVSR